MPYIANGNSNRFTPFMMFIDNFTEGDFYRTIRLFFGTIPTLGGDPGTLMGGMWVFKNTSPIEEITIADRAQNPARAMNGTVWVYGVK